MAKNNAVKILRGSRSAIASSTEILEYGQLLYNKDDNFLYCGNGSNDQQINQVAPIHAYQLRRGGSNTTNDDDGISFTADEGLKISTHDNKITLSENGTNKINLSVTTYGNGATEHVLTSDTAIALKQKKGNDIATIGWTSTSADQATVNVNTIFGSNSNKKVVVTASDSDGTKTPSIKVQEDTNKYAETTPTKIKVQSSDNEYAETTPTYIRAYTSTSYLTNITPGSINLNGTLSNGTVENGVTLSTNSTKGVLICSTGATFKGSVQVGYINDTYSGVILSSDNTSSSLLANKPFKVTDSSTTTIESTKITLNDNIILTAVKSTSTNNGTLTIGTSTEGKSCDAVVSGNIYATNGNISADGTLTIGGSSGATLEWDDTNSKLQTTNKIKTTNTMEAATFIATSDRRLKTNIVPFTNFNKNKKSILDLPIYEFDYIKTPNIHTIGCMAQDLQEICPELVSEDANGYLSIAESKLIYLLLEEVKMLKKQISSLK